MNARIIVPQWEAIGLCGYVMSDSAGILLAANGRPLFPDIAVQTARNALIALLCEDPAGRA